jgi:hypothetical protein
MIRCPYYLIRQKRAKMEVKTGKIVKIVIIQPIPARTRESLGFYLQETGGPQKSYQICHYFAAKKYQILSLFQFVDRVLRWKNIKNCVLAACRLDSGRLRVFDPPLPAGCPRSILY